MGYKDITVANIASLTDDVPWQAVTVGYYHDEERYPHGLFIWAGTRYTSETIDHDELHEKAIEEDILSDDSENEVPPWGCRLEPDRYGIFHMTERSSERKHPISPDKLDHFIDYISDLYAKLRN